MSFNSLVILGAWTICNHMNDCLQNRSPSMECLLQTVGTEVHQWILSGAKGLITFLLL